MRKSITLCPKLQDVVSHLSSLTGISESAIINFAIYRVCCFFNDIDEQKFFDGLSDFYWSYYVKQLPRGTASKNNNTEVL